MANYHQSNTFGAINFQGVFPPGTSAFAPTLDTSHLDDYSSGNISNYIGYDESHITRKPEDALLNNTDDVYLSNIDSDSDSDRASFHSVDNIEDEISKVSKDQNMVIDEPSEPVLNKLPTSNEEGLTNPNTTPGNSAATMSSHKMYTVQLRPSSKTIDISMSVDLVDKIKGMYRILDILSDTGSGGLVDKVVIDQESVGRFINHIRPGAYKDLTNINFLDMDNLAIKPIGVYGSKSEIVRLLLELQVIDQPIASLLNTTNPSISTSPHLRSGLYALIPGRHSSAERPIYIIFWPDDETWNDAADSTVRRNRYTFMRYLSKITDQMIALISEEHANMLVWKQSKSIGDDDDSFVLDEEEEETDRLFTFEVHKASEQEESVSFHEGININDNRIKDGEASDQLAVTAAQLTVRMIGGETRQAIMTVEYEHPGAKEKPFREDYNNRFQLIGKLTENHATICLGRDLSYDAAKLLASTKIAEQYPKPFSCFSSRDSAINVEIECARKENADKMKDILDEMAPKLISALEVFLVGKIVERLGLINEVDIYFHMGKDMPSKEKKEANKDYMRNLFNTHNSLESMLDNESRDVLLLETRDESAKFSKAMRGIYICQYLFDNNEISFEDRVAISQYVSSNNMKEASNYVKSNPVAKGSVLDGVISVGQSLLNVTWPRWGISKSPVDLAREACRAKRSDNFFAEANKIVSSWPELIPNFEKAIEAACEHYAKAVTRITNRLRHRILGMHETQLKALTGNQVDQIANEKKRESLSLLFDELKDSGESDSENTIILEKLTLKTNTYHNTISGCITGRRRVRPSPSLKYTIYPLELKEKDRQQLNIDATHIPKPVIAPHNAYNFRLPLSASIKFIKLLGDGKCLVVIEGQNHDLDVYLEDLSSLEGAIRHKHWKKTFKREKTGEDIHLAYDEKTKKILVCGIHNQPSSIQLWVYAFNDNYITLQAAGSSINLTSSYSQGVPTLYDIHFVSGCDEFALVETSGLVRVFSTVTQQFRPAILQLPSTPHCSFTTPEGSCLGVTCCDDRGMRVIFYHWASLSSHPGFSYSLPGNVLKNQIPIISAFDDKKNVHLIWLDESNHSCQSIGLSITQQITEFQFCEKGSKALAKDAQSHTKINSLIDCHSEVWTRFPVIPAIQRRAVTSSELRKSPSIMFTTSKPSDFPFPEYFQNMIQELERSTKKPATAVLNQIQVANSEFADTIIYAQGNIDVSTFKAGEWMVDIFCLIPIQIALARDNRFIPIKDGVWSPKFEKSLLGMDVGTVSDSLSFGWYESIFRSYMSSKPVKVISSMGEQSVGKSFALNHLADTSFAGSAMRTTEGVWMSVTPTDTDLVVVLDFEGVHSIERSAQEDTLLVLFNAAISNLVLFRNNFALSRDIADLFQSFQASSSILDPESNPSLFQSTLVIIIKDVVDSDRIEITKEFKLKLHKIVQEEQAANFISRLYRGRVDIIPWPVIESRQFYTLFSTLNKKHLIKQSLTPERGSTFLQKLKMLMAKLKTNDWGSMTQNISTHRAQFMLSFLNQALSTGFSERSPDDEPLRDLETGIILPSEDTDAVFYIESMADQQGDKESALRDLIHRWPEYKLRGEESVQSRTTRLCNFLNELADKRISHVQTWINANLSQFQESNAAIEELRRAMETKTIEIKRGISICKVQCEDCHLLCLHPPFHSGRHDCETDHTCHSPCQFFEEHYERRSCGLQAGHEGKHICDPSMHLCGKECARNANKGCQGRCTKVASHSDDEHLCSARRHFCGKPCDLNDVKLHDGSIYTCRGSCSYLWDEAHDLHACDVTSCPITCQLCGRLCESIEHLHGLNEREVHLCGQEHMCKEKCQSIGVCEIDTVPHSIQETFNGVHDQFQYTKYSQDTKRLPCAIPLPSGCLQHTGPHVHSIAADVFHYCDKRCESCGYVCTLPQGHPQPEHSTNHGSMSQTRWAIEGQNESIEVDSHKFGSNDDGAPMLCNLVCSNMGRHVHIDYCRSQDPNVCNTAETVHITTRMDPNPDQPKDWVTHNLHWRRLGFKDPYSREERANFAKCDAMCCGPEHKDPPVPSYCNLPHFHPPAPLSQAPANGHVSNDGHVFICKNPAVLNQAFHVIFVVDRSGSMSSTDRYPLPNLPASPRISQVANNRLGAVYTALCSFWIARHAATNQGAAQNRRDAYSMILFNSSTAEIYANDFNSTPDQLIDPLLQQRSGGGTNFNNALVKANEVMERHWSTERSPIIIFLSDGECSMTDGKMYDLCRNAIRLGRGLSFHAVSFGPDGSSTWLRRMVQIAKEVQATAPRDPLLPATAIVESSYAVALDSVRLAETFLGIAESLRKTRGGLIR